MNFRQRVQRPIEAKPTGTVGMPLRGGVLILVRGIWIAGVVLALGLFAANIPGYFASLHVVCVPGQCNLGVQLTDQDVGELRSLGISLDAYATLQVAFSLLFLSICVGIGLLIFWRKFDDPMGLLASFVLIVTGTTLKGNVLSALPPSWHILVELVPFLGNISGVLLGYVFSGGHFAPRWVRWVFLADVKVSSAILMTTKPLAAFLVWLGASPDSVLV